MKEHDLNTILDESAETARKSLAKRCERIGGGAHAHVFTIVRGKDLVDVMRSEVERMLGAVAGRAAEMERSDVVAQTANTWEMLVMRALLASG